MNQQRRINNSVNWYIIAFIGILLKQIQNYFFQYIGMITVVIAIGMLVRQHLKNKSLK